MTDGPISIGEFRYDPALGELRSERRRQRLRPQAAALLELLVEQQGRVVSRDTIRESLWPSGAVLEFDTAISACVKQLRKALRDSATSPRYIETIPRRGYRLLATVESTSQAQQPGLRTRRWILLGALAALLLCAALLLLRTTSPPRTMVMVLPLQSPAGSGEVLAASQQLTDGLISRLGTVAPQRIGVIARTTAAAMGGSNLTVAEMRDRLQLDYLVEGTLRRVGDQLYLTLSLVHVNDASFVWGELVQTGTHPEDIEASADYIADGILMSLAPDLRPPTSPLHIESAPTAD